MSSASDTSSSGVGLPPATYMAPKSLLKRHPPPVAAYLRAPNCPPGLDLSKPLLIYSKYISTKVRATSLRIFRDGSLARIGPALVIPNTYPGWFSIVTDDGRTARFFSSVEDVVAADVPLFLTRYDVPSYVIIENDLGISSYRRSLIQGGSLLKLIGVYEDFSSRYSDCSTKLFGCKKYAQCLDANNQRVYLPLNVKGKFYSAGGKSSKNPSNVYMISHILKHFKLPISVKLVCGYMPRAPCSFTGLLRLEKSQQEEVMLACTMTSEATATFFEIEVASNFVLTPITDSMFPKSPIYLKTISYCQDESLKWQRQIKITHHVTQEKRKPPSLSRSFSEKFISPIQDSTIRISNFSFMAHENMDKFRKKDPKPLREKIGDKFSRSHQYTKRNVKKTDRRQLMRLSKQNTYVSQLISRQRSLPGEPSNQQVSGPKSLTNVSRLSQSFDNLDYCRTVDDISPIPERRDWREGNKSENEENDHYTTIDELMSDPEIEFSLSDKFTINAFDAAKFSKRFLQTEKLARSQEELSLEGERQINLEKSKKDSFDSGHGCDCDESYFSMEGEGQKSMTEVLDIEDSFSSADSDEDSVYPQKKNENTKVRKVPNEIHTTTCEDSERKLSNDSNLDIGKSKVWLSEDIKNELQYISEGDISVISIISSSNESGSSHEGSLQRMNNSIKTPINDSYAKSITVEMHSPPSTKTEHDIDEMEKCSENINSFSQSKHTVQDETNQKSSAGMNESIPLSKEFDTKNDLVVEDNKIKSAENDPCSNEKLDQNSSLTNPSNNNEEKINSENENFNHEKSEAFKTLESDPMSKILRKGNTVVIRLNNSNSKRSVLNKEFFTPEDKNYLSKGISEESPLCNIMESKNKETVVKKCVSTVQLNFSEDNVTYQSNQKDIIKKDISNSIPSSPKSTKVIKNNYVNSSNSLQTITEDNPDSIAYVPNNEFSTNDSSFPQNHILHNFDIKKLASLGETTKDLSQKENNLIIKNSGNIKFST